MEGKYWIHPSQIDFENCFRSWLSLKLWCLDIWAKLPACFSSEEEWYTWEGEGREEPMFTSRQFLSMLASARPLVAM